MYLRSPKTLVCASLLFGSGLCSLIYQVSWIREFRAIFGVSTQASGAVLAIFLGGLGLGAWFLGRRCDRQTQPLRMYAHLELGIAVSVLLGMLVLPLVKEAYISLGGLEQLGRFWATIVRLLLATLVIGPPTFLMGGTLPAMTRALGTTHDPSRLSLGTLYGANTLGAFSGGLLAAFALHEWLGLKHTLLSAGLLNFALALLALRLSQLAMFQPKPQLPTPLRQSFDLVPESPIYFVKIVAMTTGFLFLLQELVWYRLLAPILGGSTYTISLILCAALLGIGLGGVAYGTLGKVISPSLRVFSFSCACEAVLMGLPFALGDHFAVWVASLGGPHFSDLVLGWCLVVGVVVFPCSFVAGYQFPLVIRLLGQDPTKLGREIGTVTLLNSLGTIVGSLAGGFGLMSLLSAVGVWRLAIAVLAVLALWAWLLALKHEVAPKSTWPAPALATLALLLIVFPGPGAPWKHSGIGVGRAGLVGLDANTVHDWLNVNRRQIFWEQDGVESTIGISDLDGYAFIVNGKTDGNAIGDAQTQIMSGLIGAVLHPNPKRTLVVGLGTGSTAGWLGKVPSMEQVDVVELEPAVLEMARLSAPVNEEVLQNPKVKVFLGDAREYLLTSRASYDLIFSEPSNPYRAGISSMYTREYYQGAARRLLPNGLFVQWFQGYSVDEQTISRVYSTLLSVFPHVETWMTGNKDMILVGSAAPLVHDVAQLRQRVSEEPIARAMAIAWRVSGLEGFLSRFYASEAYSQKMAIFAPDQCNSDDRPYLEFAMARSLTSGLFDPYAAWGKMPPEWRRPNVKGDSVDWRWVDIQRVSLMPEGLPLHRTWFSETGPQAQEYQTMEALVRYFNLDRADPEYPAQLQAAAELLSEGDAAVSRDALLLKAEWSAFQGQKEQTQAFAEQLRRVCPAEAEVILAMYFANKDAAQAARHLQAAFEAHQVDPWPRPSIIEAGLMLTPWVAKNDPSSAQTLFETLSSPFAVESLKYKRLIVLTHLAEILGYSLSCRNAFEPLEPHVPWDESFLERRARFYERNHLPLEHKAAEDLALFRRQSLDL